MENSITKIGKMSRSEAGKLGALKTVEGHKLRYKKMREDYIKSPKVCPTCQNSLPYEKRRSKFCNHVCAGLFCNKSPSGNSKHKKICVVCSTSYMSYMKNSKYCNRICEKLHAFGKKIEAWKNGLEKGYSGKAFSVAKWLRRYLFQKYDNKCCKCNWSQVNPVTNNIPLEVNHINGDASDCKEENLELLCPNCHSLTFNFRSLNRNSKRER